MEKKKAFDDLFSEDDTLKKDIAKLKGELKGLEGEAKTTAEGVIDKKEKE